MKYTSLLRAFLLLECLFPFVAAPAQHMTAADLLGDAASLGLGGMMPSESRDTRAATDTFTGFRLQHVQADFRMPYLRPQLYGRALHLACTRQHERFRLHLAATGSPSTLSVQTAVFSLKRPFFPRLDFEADAGFNRLAENGRYHFTWLAGISFFYTNDSVTDFYFRTFNLLPSNVYGYHTDFRLGVSHRISANLLLTGEMEKQIAEPLLWRAAGEYLLGRTSGKGKAIMRIGGRWPYPCLNCGLGYLFKGWQVDWGLSFTPDLPVSLAGSIRYSPSRP